MFDYMFLTSEDSGMLASKELTGRYMHDSDLGPDSNVILAVTVTGYWVGG